MKFQLISEKIIGTVLHPSAQVGAYKMYLEDSHTAFYETDSPIKLNACSYLHNYNYYNDDVIFDIKFQSLLTEFPVFTADEVNEFSEYLSHKLAGGNGSEVLKRVEESKFRASKKLMQHVGNVIKGNSNYILLDDQKIIYDHVLTFAKKAFHLKEKIIMIIKGGPGTGKSVIALNLMADLLLKNYNAHYATGSKAFTETLWQIVGSRSKVQFKYFNNYGFADPDAVDVLICDEAHRIRVTSNGRFTPKAKKSDLFQIEEILRAAKVSVFFIDDDQGVRPNEIGSSIYIKEFALKYKA
ncbi:MAG: DNA/RNA helicase domain-containing protein, partial [Chitinophagales bacterium]